MSFILDALKKSETDRQRQNGPALFEVRAAPTRDKLPLWAVGLGVLLAVNLVIVAWVLLRRPASAEAAAQQTGRAAYGAGSAAMGGAQGQGPGGVQQGSAMAQGANGGGPGGYGASGNGAGQGGYGGGGPGGYGPGGGAGQGNFAAQANGAAGQGAYGTPVNGGGGPGGYGPGSGAGQGGYGGGGPGGYGPGGGAGQGNFAAQANGAVGQGAYGGGPGGAPGQPGYGGNGSGQAGYGAPAYGTQPGGPMAQTAGLTAGQQPGMTAGQGQQTPANRQGSAGAQQPAGNEASQGGEKLNPDDYAPAADPVPQPFGNHVTRGTLSGVPLYSDVAATASLPSLRLDLHVYAATPQERFVMINMHKLHEGDLMTAEGVRVESITPYGAVLSRNGTKFLLPRD